MLKTIIIHEFQDHIKSNRLWISVLFITFIIVTITISHLLDYREQVLNYNTDTNREIEANTRIVLKPPQVLSVFARGNEGMASNTAEVSGNAYKIGVDDTDHIGGNRFISESFSDTVDISFIVSVLLSLFVIFLSYDAISGEKKMGTLKSVFSNSVPRHLFLIGKIISGVLLIAIIVAVPFLIISVLFMMYPSIMLTGSDFVMILLMFVLSVSYLTIFYLISLFLSVRINNPATGLAVLLLLWLAIVHVYPSVSSLIVDTFYENPSRRAELINQTELYRQAANDLKTRRDSGEQMPLIYMTHYYDQVLNRIREQRQQALIQERRLIDAVSVLSPRFFYERAMESSSRTGLEVTRHFHNQLANYWSSSFDPRSDETDENSDAYYERIAHPPLFQYAQYPFSTTLHTTLWYLFSLVAMNIVLFMITYVSFLRKEVQ